MNHRIVVVCAWAALAVSTPTALLAQNPPPPGQGQTGGTPAPGQGGKPGQQGGTPAPGQQGGTPRPAGQTPGTGQPGQQPGQSGLPGQVGQPGGLKLRPGEDFVGMNMDPRVGNQLGRINDLVIRPDGTIGYAVLEVPGAAGANAHYPIPWGQLRYEAQPMDGTGILQGSDAKPAGKGRVVAGFESDRLKGAPSFDAERWPRDTMSFDEAERYYAGGQAKGGQADGGTGTPRPAGAGNDPADRGVGTTPAGAPNEARFRASKFKEQVVVDSTGNPIGKTGRLAIDPAQGRVNYVTVTLSNVPGGSGRTIAVPWSALRATRVGDENRLQLNLPADKLQNAPQFKAGTADWNEMADPNWVRSLYGYYGVQPYWSDMPHDGAQNPPGTRDAKPTDAKPTEPGSTGATGGQAGTPNPR